MRTTHYKTEAFLRKIERGWNLFPCIKVYLADDGRFRYIFMIEFSFLCFVFTFALEKY